MFDLLLGGLALILLGVAVPFFLASALGAPPIPPFSATRKVMVEKVRAYDPDATPVLDIGAGWGDLAIALGRAFPHRRIVAYEISPLPYVFSRLRVRILGLDNVDIFFGDGVKALENDEIHPSTVVFYLSEPVARRISRVLDRIDRLVLSKTVKLPDREPDETVSVRGLANAPVYVYRLENSPDNG